MIHTAAHSWTFSAADISTWLPGALCAQPGMDPELWHVTAGRTHALSVGRMGRAKHMCRRHCPVIEQCHEWAKTKAWNSCCVGGVVYGYGENRVSQREAGWCQLCP